MQICLQIPLSCACWQPAVTGRRSPFWCTGDLILCRAQCFCKHKWLPAMPSFQPWVTWEGLQWFRTLEKAQPRRFADRKSFVGSRCRASLFMSMMSAQLHRTTIERIIVSVATSWSTAILLLDHFNYPWQGTSSLSCLESVKTFFLAELHLLQWTGKPELSLRFRWSWFHVRSWFDIHINTLWQKTWLDSSIILKLPRFSWACHKFWSDHEWLEAAQITKLSYSNLLSPWCLSLRNYNNKITRLL